MGVVGTVLPIGIAFAISEFFEMDGVWKHVVISIGLLLVGFTGVWLWIRLLRYFDIAKVDTNSFRPVRELLSRGYNYK